MSYTEYGWVIELWGGEKPYYWNGVINPVAHFVGDNQKAARFARQQDAQQALDTVIDPDTRSVCRVIE